MPIKRIFRHKLFRRQTQRPTSPRITALPINPVTDPRALTISAQPAYTLPEPFLEIPSRRRSSTSSFFSFFGFRPTTTTVAPADDDEPPVDERQVIRQVETEYGTMVDEWKWTRGAVPEAELGAEVEVEAEAATSRRPSLIYRYTSSIPEAWNSLRRFSASSSFSRRSSRSENGGVVAWGGDGDEEGVVDNVSVSEDPLAFAKPGPVELRMGETELLSPVTFDVRLRKRGRREEFREWIGGLRRERAI